MNNFYRNSNRKKLELAKMKLSSVKASLKAKVK